MKLLLLLLLFPSVVSGMSVTLAWDANPEPDIAGYKVYWGTTSGEYTDTLEVPGADPEPQVTVEDIPTRLTYFVVTAYNTDGLESEYSNEVLADPFDPVTNMNVGFENVLLLPEDRMSYALRWDEVLGAYRYEVWAGGAAIRFIYAPSTSVDLEVPRNTFVDRHAVYYIKAFAQDGTLITISEEASILTYDSAKPTNIRISYD